MKSPIRLGTMLLACLFPAAATGNGVSPMPLDAQLLRADLVAIGELGSPTHCLVAGGRYPCAELRSEAILKGTRPAGAARLYLLLFSGVMELSVDSTRITGRALFFLRRADSRDTIELSDRAEFYRPVQGQNSILLLGSSGTR